MVGIGLIVLAISIFASVYWFCRVFGNKQFVITMPSVNVPSVFSNNGSKDGEYSMAVDKAAASSDFSSMSTIQRSPDIIPNINIPDSGKVESNYAIKGKKSRENIKGAANALKKTLKRS